jgi:hypothetical protein
VTRLLFACFLLTACATKPEAPAPSPSATAGSVDKMALAVFASLEHDDVDGAVRSFGPQLSRAVPAAKLQEVWHQMVSQLGPLTEYRIIERGQQQGLETRVVTLRFAHGQALADVAVNTSDGSIEQLFIGPAGSPGRAASPSQ